MANIKVHWSFWVICIAALVWNLMSCINFIMQMNPHMPAHYPEEAMLLIESRPLWATAAFFIAVFIGVLVTNVYTFQVTSASSIWIGSLMSLVIAILLIAYSKWTKRKGWIN